MAVKVQPLGPAEFLVIDDDGRHHRIFVAGGGARRWAFWNGQVWETGTEDGPRTRSRTAVHESLSAPMPATVVRIPVGLGDRVTKGQTVIVLEAMKMELPLRAAHDGSVTAIQCEEGQLVQPGVTLIEIE